MTTPQLSKINEDKYTLKMPGYSRKFYLNNEELSELENLINKEID